MAFTSFSIPRTTAFVMILFIVGIAVLAAPVTAATKYVGGSPQMSASIVGVNEFQPGQDATISILVKNTGTPDMKQLDLGTIEYEDLPTTAKFVTAGLASESPAIIIKTDPQMVGSIPASGTGTTIKFAVKISTNATAGEYTLPLVLSYEYPRVIRQEKADVFEYTYNNVNETIPVTIRIKPEVKIAVLEAAPEPLSAGTAGYLSLKIRNDGPENGTRAVVKLNRNGKSAIIPTDSTVFIGDFPSGGIAECRYKISATDDAVNQTYPVDVVVSYTNREGSIVTSKTETIGIPVNGKIFFTIVSAAPSLQAGTQASIEVQYRNNGYVTARDAQARITPHSPVSSDDNVAYLGDIGPGAIATAHYTLTAEGNAEPGTYAFDSKVRFRDALGNSQESDTISVNVTVTPGTAATIGGLPAGAVYAGIILVVIAAAIALLVYRRRKSQQ